MSDLVQLSKDNDIAIIMINNPPVNALSPGVPEGISEAIEQIDKDPTVKAAVLIGAGKTFVAGADIKEFGKMTSGKTRGGIPFLPLLMRIEDCSKPVVMAIHGTAFGGGLELAMAGHYRVAAPSGAGGPAGSEAWHYSRRSRNAALAAAGRRGESRGDVCWRRSDQSERSVGAGHRRQAD